MTEGEVQMLFPFSLDIFHRKMSRGEKRACSVLWRYLKDLCRMCLIVRAREVVLIGTASQKVLFSGFRGGNWNNGSSNSRVSDRNNAANTNTSRNNNNGGRCAKTFSCYNFIS